MKKGKYEECSSEENRMRRTTYGREYRWQIKAEVLTYYGNGKLACVKCGFDDIRGLTIDHICGGGTKHKASLGSSNLYLWLKRNGFPKGYQTLCANCNLIKEIVRKSGVDANGVVVTGKTSVGEDT